MDIRVQFAVWGAITYLTISVGLLFGLLAFLIQKNVIGNFVVFGIDFYANTFAFFFLPIILGFLFGWISRYFGIQLKCESCEGLVLKSDEYGFRGLTIRPIISAAKGRALCSKCK